MDSKARFELYVPGDAGHVAHRVAEARKALQGLGFRVSASFVGDITVVLMMDETEPVDSSTVDEPAVSVWRDQPMYQHPPASPDPEVPDLSAVTFWAEGGYIDETGPVPVVVGDPRVGAVRADAPGPPYPEVVDGDVFWPVLVPDLCGLVACGHDKAQHVDGRPRAAAGMSAALPPGTHCTAQIAPGHQCRCPGFMPVTGTIDPARRRANPGPT